MSVESASSVLAVAGLLHAQRAQQRNRGVLVGQSLGPYASQLLKKANNPSATPRLCKSPLTVTFVRVCEDCNAINSTGFGLVGQAVARAAASRSLASFRTWDYVLHHTPVSQLLLPSTELEPYSTRLERKDAALFSSRLLSMTTDVDADTFMVFVVPPIKLNGIDKRRLRFQGADHQSQQSVFSQSDRDRVLIVATDELNDQVENFVANETLNWLLGDAISRLPESDIKFRLCNDCVVEAATSIQTSLAVLSAVHNNKSTEIFNKEVHTAISRIEETAKSLSLLGSNLDANPNPDALDSLLNSCRAAWEAAQAVARHSDLALQPHLPVEHALALMLPLGMPVSLAILQSLVSNGRCLFHQYQSGAKSKME
jgi:hypothetical protein